MTAHLASTARPCHHVPRLHACLLAQWGRSALELQAFPQTLTYSLHYLRARAGFLKLHGREAKLHRTLRSAEHSFATKLAKSTVEEYQACHRILRATRAQRSQLP